MNASDLWSGNDYAHTDSISRGVTYYERATRVKVMRVFKEHGGYGRERATTMVEVLVLNDDGTIKKNMAGGDLERKVRARDIFMRWDEYENERKHRHDKRAELALKEQQAREAEEKAKSNIIEALEKKFNEGFNRLMIDRITEYGIQLNRREVERWLGINE